jgi:hypothetical protein
LTTNTGASIGSGTWAHPNAPLQFAPKGEGYVIPQHHSQFHVEKVDNGFIIRSGKYSKICKDMTELSEQFVAIMVEAQLDK